MAHLPVNNFEFRVFPPNEPIVVEGQQEEYVWFVRKGSLRVVKLAAFKQVQREDGVTELQCCSPDEKLGRRSSFSSNDSKDETLTTRLLNVRSLGPGDYFGQFRSLISFENEDTLEPLQEKERRRFPSS